MVRLNRPLEDADLALMDGAGGHLMAVLLKEEIPANEVPARSPESDALAQPFDVVTYAGPITVDGYERLSALIHERQTHKQVLVVLETPGGDPHAAFRIARALGFHYERVEAFVPRFCKSAGTLITIGASVLHMDDRGELGPLDMQVPRANEIASHGSALEFSETLNLLWAQQLQSFSQSMRDMAEKGMSTEIAALAAAKLVGGIFRPIAQQVDPMKLTTMSRAISIAVAYSDRLAAKGKNIAPMGIRQLVYGYPSHSFVIDRKEAGRLFFDVRPPTGPIFEVAQWCRSHSATWAEAAAPTISLDSFPFVNEEMLDAQEGSHTHRAHGGAQASRHDSPGALPGLVRSGKEADSNSSAIR